MAAEHEELLEQENSVTVENLLEDFTVKQRAGGLYSASRTFVGEQAAALLNRYREEKSTAVDEKIATDVEAPGYDTRARLFYSGNETGTLHFISENPPEEWDPENPVIENYQEIVNQ